MARTTTARTQSTPDRAAVLAARGKLIEWETTLADAEGELASLQAQTGEQALEDPGLAFSIPRQMQEQRDRIEVAERAIAAQEQHVKAVERAWLLAEAAVLQREVDAARARLDKHNARTNELLEQLREHEGPYIAEGPVQAERALLAQYTAGITAGITVKTTRYRSHELADAVKHAERPVAILRAMAEGRNPGEVTADLGAAEAIAAYPSCVWGPDALVPAPRYLREVDDAQAEVESCVARQDNLEANVETARRELKEALEQYTEDGHPRSSVGQRLSPDDRRHPDRFKKRLRYAERLVAENIEALASAQRTLSELTGEPIAAAAPAVAV